MGGAQPLAASLAGACSLNIECQQKCIDMRLRTRYVDEQATDLEDALARIDKYTPAGEAKPIALLGNAAEILPQPVERGVRPESVTHQTSHPHTRHGHPPTGWNGEQWPHTQHHTPDTIPERPHHTLHMHQHTYTRT